MKELNLVETQEVNGAGFFKFVLPVIIGFFTGGPAGAVAGAGAAIAMAGVNNLEHLSENRKIPTIHEMLNK